MTAALETLTARFWQRVIRAEHGCWDWNGPVAPNPGYPKLGIGKRGKIYAHRLSYLIHHGAIPDGKHVCHTCDNKRCSNPAHLFLGTNLDNARDAREKGLRLKSTCRRGHARSPENTYTRTDRRGYVERHCLDCKHGHA